MIEERSPVESSGSCFVSSGLSHPGPLVFSPYYDGLWMRTQPYIHICFLITDSLKYTQRDWALESSTKQVRHNSAMQSLPIV